MGIPERIKLLIDELRSEVKNLDSNTRFEVLYEIGQGYCRDCGRDCEGSQCYCMNDE